MRIITTLLFLLLSAPAYSTTVLVVGDSISAAFGLTERQGWVQLTEDALAEKYEEIEFINASISGDTTGGGLARLPEALNRFEPDVVIIELGGNDGLRGYSLKEMRENLITMVEIAQATSAEVLLLGMQIPTNYGAAYTRRFAENGRGATFTARSCPTQATTFGRRCYGQPTMIPRICPHATTR